MSPCAYDRKSLFSSSSIRIGVVLPVLLLAHASASRAETLWCSPFETASGTPVTENEVADVIDNVVGAPGVATGNLATLDPLIYVEYGVAVPGVPGSIDPAGQADSFALSTPDDRRTGFNTGLRSDAGDLANNLTFEGYFFMPSDEPILDPSFVGRRLVTQKRSADDANSRLAIGIHGDSTLVGYMDGLFDYDGFDYTGTDLGGQNGGIGWSAPWDDGDGDFSDKLSNDGVSLDSPAFPFTPVGSRISGVGGEAVRNLSRTMDLGVDGEAMYVSTLIRRGEPVTTSAAAMQLMFRAGTSTSLRFRIGITSDSQFFVGLSGVDTGPGIAVVPDTVYFLVAKVVASSDGDDQAFLNIYGPGDTVPVAEPETWDIATTGSFGDAIGNLRLDIGGNNSSADVDEIRIGSTYGSVTDPDAPLGDPGQLETDNLLSVFWAEQVPPVLPEDPPTLTNHLEFGTTPLVANTWYHFALVYDGADITWYLDGVQEGQVAAPPATETTAGLHPVGPATMAVANNRSRGATDDRGFFGVLDEIRIWETALTPAQMLVQGGLPDTGLLWQSRFETNLGLPVTNAQPAESPNCIDNEFGPPNGTPAGVIASFYTSYGQPDVPAIPVAIDPVGFAETFAILMPDATNTAINTTLPSDSGNLANAVTAQGYFNTFQEAPVGPSAVGSRLVSMQRSALQGQVRLGIGLAAAAGADPPHNVLSLAYHDGGGVVVVPGSTQIVPNTWYHFALVWDGADIRWYLDGAPEGEVLGASLMGPGTGEIAIGNDRTAGNGTRGFFGLLDKVVIEDTARDPADFMTAGIEPCGITCPVPFADADDDGDVDQKDFAIAQLCATGEGGGVPGGCQCFDRDLDDDVDGADFMDFGDCATGPDVPWTQEATPSCVP